jgi:hypothetical protein
VVLKTSGIFSKAKVYDKIYSPFNKLFVLILDDIMYWNVFYFPVAFEFFHNPTILTGTIVCLKGFPQDCTTRRHL